MSWEKEYTFDAGDEIEIEPGLIAYGLVCFKADADGPFVSKIILGLPGAKGREICSGANVYQTDELIRIAKLFEGTCYAAAALADWEGCRHDDGLPLLRKFAA